MNWTALLTSEINATYAATDRMMGLLTDADLGWKPATGENWMTAGQLLKHLETACGMCCQGFVTGDWGMPDDCGDKPEGAEPQLPTAAQLPAATSVAAARAALEADRKVALQMVEKAGEQNLDTLETAAPWEPDNTRLLGHHLLIMVQHLASHKSQLFYYLKLMGRKVDTMTLWGM
ncbi:DinB family protein [bacterium]|nr:DinB family protein [bacterium]